MTKEFEGMTTEYYRGAFASMMAEFYEIQNRADALNILLRKLHSRFAQIDGLIDTFDQTVNESTKKK